MLWLVERATISFSGTGFEPGRRPAGRWARGKVAAHVIHANRGRKQWSSDRRRVRRRCPPSDPDECGDVESDFHQLADAVTVEHLEGILRQDFLGDIVRQEAGDVVAAQAKGGLGQIVGAEAEEVGVFGDAWAISAARGSSIMVP